MKNILTFWLLTAIHFSVLAQDPEGAKNKINEGIAAHDRGDFATAIKKYEVALELDNNNMEALAEMALSLMSMGRYEESVEYCKRAISNHKGDPLLASVYSTYGSALDALKKNDEAIDIYNEAISQFPDDYLLHFNLGVSISVNEDYDKALLSFHKAAELNPMHAGTHRIIGLIQAQKGNKIPAIMALSRFLVVEPEGPRAEYCLSVLRDLIAGSSQKTGKNSISITLNGDILGDTTATGKPNPNNFGMVEMMLSLSGALDLTKANKKDSEAIKFKNRMQSVASALASGKNEGNGFYWEYYAPYFIAMNDMGHLETFSNVAFASLKNSKIKKWIKKHPNEIAKFYKWSENYDWE
ncbi:MAG: tetratricopeptide repeat protein [Flavobacteriales bacterium]